MGRKSAFNQTLTWVKLLSVDKSIQKRKYYSASELLDIYLDYCKKNGMDVNYSRSEYCIRAFTSHLNNIAKTSNIKQLRYIYNKVDGYRYILVHDHEIDSDLSQIRISRRFNN